MTHLKYSIRSFAAALVVFAALPAMAGLKEGIASYQSKDYRTAFAELQPLALDGDGQAMYYLGMLYSDGLGMDKDLAEGARWFRRSADQGNANGQNALGYSYLVGEGVDKNFESARLWLGKAAAQGSTKAYRHLGAIYLEGSGVSKDEAQATAWYRKAADAGDPLGFWLVGQSHELGRGVPKDAVEAVKWYRKAAEQGEANGQFALWRMYSYGLGVKKDEALGLDWLRKAADQGASMAQYRLGAAYEEGTGVKQDDQIALDWYFKAARQGHVGGQSMVGHFHKNGRGISQDYAQAAVWLRKAADQGDKEAQDELGQLYMRGAGVQQDMVQAASWYLKAAEQGMVDAQTNLAVLYRKGDGVPKDGTKAIHWATKAATNGNLNAAFNLGNMYEVGDASPANGSDAVKWYLKAAQGNHPEAQYRLGAMYFQGSSIEQNLAAAVPWLRRASDNKHPSAQVLLAKLLEAGWNGAPDINGASALYKAAAQAGNAEARERLLALENARTVKIGPMASSNNAVGQIDPSCFMCSPGYVPGQPVRGQDTLGSIANVSLGDLSSKDASFMGNLYGFCIAFSGGINGAKTLRRRILEEMEKRLPPSGSIDAYFIEAGCNPEDIGSTRVPIAHIVAEHPWLVSHLEVLRSYFIEKGRVDLFARMLNARNTQGMSTLDYLEYLVRERKIPESQIEKYVPSLTAYICKNGGEYSPHVGACDPAEHASKYEALRKLADGGDRDALVKLGDVHDKGRLGMPVDCRKAIPHYRAAASRGDRHYKALFAEFHDGRSPCRNLAEAVAIWTELGNSKRIAFAYASGGPGIPKDFGQGQIWFEKAYRSGDVDALTWLVRYATEEKDQSALFRWLKVGAADGRLGTDDRAKMMNQLANHYKEGIATAQNYPEFLRLRYETAIDDRMFRRMADEWVLSDQPVFERLARQGDRRAMFLAGFYYSRVSAEIRNLEKSAFWYQKAAELNDPHAMNALGWLHEGHSGFARDMKASRSWYVRAAELGLDKAKEKLANWKGD